MVASGKYNFKSMGFTVWKLTKLVEWLFYV